MQVAKEMDSFWVAHGKPEHMCLQPLVPKLFTLFLIPAQQNSAPFPCIWHIQTTIRRFHSSHPVLTPTEQSMKLYHKAKQNKTNKNLLKLDAVVSEP